MVLAPFLRNTCRAAAALVVLLGGAAAVSAQSMDFSGEEASGDAQPQVEYERKQVVNFADDTITGELTSPDIDYIEARKKARHRSLIRIRENFRDEILSSINDL